MSAGKPHHPTEFRNAVGYFRALFESGWTATTIRALPRMIEAVTAIAAFVLAGGRSTRMGLDKAFLELGGELLIARALALAGLVSDQTAIVGDRQKFSAFAPVVEDLYSQQGPLAGIHAALRSSSRELNLILAVDLPLLSSRFLSYLIAEAESTSAIATVPSASGGFQPLCAVYRKAFQGVAERALARGRNKVDALFGEVPLRVISEKEIVARGFRLSIFRNLNTPRDWEEVRQEFLSLGQT